MRCIEIIIFASCTQTYLVTGGNIPYLASTELLHQDASQWVYAGSLPSAKHGVRGATLGDKLIMTGEMMRMMMYKHINLMTIARWQLCQWWR